MKELGAEAKRSGRPLACVAIGPSAVDSPEDRGGDDPSGDGEFARQLGEILLSLTRASDAVARMASHDFVIVAPGTDKDGADRLIQRVLEKSGEPGRPAVSLQAGVCAVSGADADSPAAAEEFLRRATNALRDVQTRRSWGDGRNPLIAFGPN